MERAEERHEREREEKCSDSSGSLLNRDFFSLATMSHCLSEEGSVGKKPLELWNV